jgi:hypothetical protein
MLALIDVYLDTVLPLTRPTAVLAAQAADLPRTLEVRAYQLKGGAGPAFARIFRERAGPMLRAHGMDVVGFGQSLHAVDAYYLLRAFDSLDHLRRSENDFYGSDAWRNGPREEVLSHIENTADTVLALSPEAVEAIRRELS